LCTEIYFPNGVHVVFNEPVSSDYLKKIVGWSCCIYLLHVSIIYTGSQPICARALTV
jgi:hypothetical protein